MASTQLTLGLQQLATPTKEALTAVKQLATSSNEGSRGAVYTRFEVVEFILDLLEYTENQPICERRLLEPSFGGGDFLLPAIRRLLAAWRATRSDDDVLAALGGALRAVELHQDTFQRTRTAVITLLEQENIASRNAESLADSWLMQGDFLLSRIEHEFDYVVGNPPYIRQELIPESLLTEYRSRFRTMYDRADIYIPFMEKSLSLLASGGQLGFICSDRWMKNKYGGPLRGLVSESFHLKAYIDMVDTPAFHSDVVAYPAITVISKEESGVTRTTRRPSIDRATLSSLAKSIIASKIPEGESEVVEVAHVVNGTDPWLLETVNHVSLIRRLESCYPALEEAGCKIGIGVATGADKVFIGEIKTLDVEADRILPIVTTKDVASGQVEWQGKGVINPFSESGGLVDLAQYPRLKCYLELHRDAIAHRHCARKTPKNWYRTIDRIHPKLSTQEKLLIPDIKGEAHIVYEGGKYYPHHNLYFVTSEHWDLRALQAVLLSEVARLFVSTYSVKMRGGYLRFQAQYLRRIRIPKWDDVDEVMRSELCAAAESGDINACNRAVFKLYNLTPEEQETLGDQGGK